MIPPRWTFVLAVGLAGAGAASAACFTVFDARDRVVYQSTTPPVDISLPLSQAVAAVYPRGHHLLMTDDAYCPGFDGPPTVNPAPRRGARTLAGGSPALALADAYVGRHRREDEDTIPRHAGTFSGLVGRDAAAVTDAAPAPKPRRRAPVSGR